MPVNSVLLRVVSAWEMQIKYQLGKLEPRLPLAEILSSQQASNQISILPVTLDHVLALQDLPKYHGDPFDRILIAQAAVEDAVLVSHDASFSRYDVPLLW